MNRIPKIFIAILLLLPLIYSCTKEDPIIDPTKTPEERLVGNWKLTEFESDYLGGIMINAYPFLQPCFTDNILMFFADHTFVMEEAETKCAPHHPQIYEQGDWVFLDNGKKIKYGTYEVEILELSDTKLKSTYQLQDTIQNITSTFIQTFTKIDQ